MNAKVAYSGGTTITGRLAGGYHDKGQGWITGVERQSTVGNVPVGWTTPVQEGGDATAAWMMKHGEKTADTWQTRTHCQLHSWDLVTLVVARNLVAIHWENCVVGINYGQDYVSHLYNGFVD